MTHEKMIVGENESARCVEDWVAQLTSYEWSVIHALGMAAYGGLVADGSQHVWAKRIGWVCFRHSS